MQSPNYHPHLDVARPLALLTNAGAVACLLLSYMAGRHYNKQMMYLLFAYWDIPHCDTGFRPFGVLYSHNVCVPLELMKDAWLEEK